MRNTFLARRPQPDWFFWCQFFVIWLVWMIVVKLFDTIEFFYQFILRYLLIPAVHLWQSWQTVKASVTIAETSVMLGANALDIAAHAAAMFVLMLPGGLWKKALGGFRRCHPGYYLLAIVAGCGIPLVTDLLLGDVPWRRFGGQFAHVSVPALFMVLGHAALEEIFWRSAFFKGDTKNVTTTTLLLSGIFFGYSHYFSGFVPLSMTSLAFTGVLFALLFYLSGSVTVPIVCHWFYNMTINLAIGDWDYGGHMSSIVPNDTDLVLFSREAILGGLWYALLLTVYLVVWFRVKKRRDASSQRVLPDG